MMKELKEQGQTNRAIAKTLNAAFHGGQETRTMDAVVRRLRT